MNRWLRRIRGTVGMGLTWAAGWSLIGAIVGFANLSGLGGGLLVPAFTSLLYAASGFLSGAAFSVVLGITEGRRRFDQASLPRFAGWGAVGGFLVAGLLVTISVALGGAPSLFRNLGVVGLLGAGSAAGSLALARRADDRELLDAGEDIAEIGLSQDEARELLAP